MRELMLWFTIILFFMGFLVLMMNAQKTLYYDYWYEDMVIETIEQYLEEKEQTEKRENGT